MTIYTFGDPELLREALLALATIFSLVEWGDPGSAMGLGGNMLAVALIGLLAVGIAGVTSQQIRVDFLLVALILFGVAFSSRVDVNVEDIQTGDSRVVADIPIGIAMVAAASSSAARSLTETTSVALQRPGSTTSVLTDSGFLDPLRNLYALRELSYEHLDQYLYRSLLEWYKMCIGNTLATNPTLFNINDFRNAADPLDYMMTPGRYLNFSTVYYSEADPAGTPVSCAGSAPVIRARIDAITVAGSDEALAKIRLERGAKLYNTPFEFADVDDASTIISRGIFDGQAFMRSAAMRNFINVAEAWRLAGYGTNEAQYVATLTEAYENKRVQDAAAGTIALQYMFPLMTFFQFLFFTLAPFIALVMIASPFTAGKVLGTYFLFGVWAYSWMPIAAVINHYIQITIGNTLEFSDIAVAGVQYTALNGMDSLYDQLANKLSIGSMALAATPIIVGAVLTASMTGLTSLAGRFASAGSTNTSISSPRLGEGRALVAAGGMGTVREGLALGTGGSAEIASYQQRTAFGQAAIQNTVQSGAQVTREAAMRAEASLEGSKTRLSEAMNQFTQQGIVMQQSSASFSTDMQKAIEKAFSGRVSYNDIASMSASERRMAESHLSLPGGFFSVGQRSMSGTGNDSALQRIKAMDSSEGSKIAAKFGEEFSTTESGRLSAAGSLSEASKEVLKNQEEWERAHVASTKAATSAQTINQMTHGGSIELVDLLQSRYAGGDRDMVYQGMQAIVAGDLPGYVGEIQATQKRKHFNDGNPIRGRDGLPDENMDYIDKGGTLMLAVADLATKNPQAYQTLSKLYQYLGRSAGTTVHHGTELLAEADERLAAGAAIDETVTANVGGFESGMRNPAGYDERTAQAADAYSRGGTAPVVDDDRRQWVEDRGAGFVERAGSESGLGNQAGAFGATATYVEAAFESRENVAPTMTDKAVKWWTSETGFEQSANTYIPRVLAAAGTDAEGGAIVAALGGLQGEVTSQLGDEFRTFDARKTYDNFRNRHDLEPVDALVATYASLGAKMPGAGDYMAGALMGAAGFKATKGGPPKLRAAAGIVAVAGGIAGAYAAWEGGQENQKESLRFLQDTYKQRFAQLNPSPQMAKAFGSDVDAARDTGDLVDIMKRYDDYDLSSDQVMEIVAPREAAMSDGQALQRAIMERSMKAGYGD